MQSEETVSSNDQKILAGCELLSVTLSFLITVWVVLPLSDNSKTVAALFALITFVFMYYSHRTHGESLRDLGWRTDNLIPALRYVLVFTVLSAVGLIFCGWLMGSLGSAQTVAQDRLEWAFAADDQEGRLHGAALLWRLAMLFSGLVQQYLIQGFINRRAQMVWGKGWVSILFVAVIFALFHLPNYWLMAATLIGGAAWAFIYQQTPNLYALALSHLISTALLLFTLPAQHLHGLRVGLRFFN